MPAPAADSQDQINMASVIVTLRVMPESADVELKKLEGRIVPLISGFGGRVAKTEQQPIAFGLKALLIYFVMDESKGSTEPLEKQISQLAGVMNAIVDDVRRTVG